MTTASLPGTAVRHRGAVATQRAETNLRRILAANATSSGLAGVAGLVAASWWADTLGIPGAGWVRVVSAGLVLFGLEVGWVAARATRSLRPAAVAVSVADAAWIAATVVVLASVELTTTGRVLAVGLGVAVADFALLQVWFRSRMERPAPAVDQLPPRSQSVAS